MNVIEYLKRCKGQDILVFATSEEATEVARKLRQSLAGDVNVSASYNKVWLKLDVLNVSKTEEPEDDRRLERVR